MNEAELLRYNSFNNFNRGEWTWLGYMPVGSNEKLTGDVRDIRTFPYIEESEVGSRLNWDMSHGRAWHMYMKIKLYRVLNRKEERAGGNSAALDHNRVTDACALCVLWRKRSF
jgi:hypothetical protein